MDSIDICNLALNMLGIASIVSLEDTNNNAKLCKAFFPVCRDRVLRDHSWSFAAKSYELSKLPNDTTLDPNLPFVCGVPADCIAVRDILYGIRYKTWGRRIMVEALPATMIYTARIEDTSLFDATFCEALQYSLAGEIAMGNSRHANLLQMFRQEYERRLAIARSIDSQENKYDYQNTIRKSSWISARGAGTDEVSRQSGPINWVKGTEGVQK